VDVYSKTVEKLPSFPGLSTALYSMAFR